jgi:acyl-CoA synthetase (AMP-forming)/AMP-acid ligase II
VTSHENFLSNAETCRRALSVDPAGLRTLISYGGAPIAPDLVARLGKAFPQARLGNGFGLTETSSVSTFLPHEFVAHADSVGFPAPVVDVRLDNVAPDGTGELLIRGQNIVCGYWNKPEATAETFVDGWLHSGDAARIDDEGLVYLVDRIKDMINRGGENVYCVEVENALAGAPGVYEAAVLGVPDEMMGEKVGAVIVPMPGATLDVPAVLGYLGAHRRLQGPAVRRGERDPAAAQPRRQAAQAAAARRRRLGRRFPPLTAMLSSVSVRSHSVTKRREAACQVFGGPVRPGPSRPWPLPS